MKKIILFIVVLFCSVCQAQCSFIKNDTNSSDRIIIKNPGSPIEVCTNSYRLYLTPSLAVDMDSKMSMFLIKYIVKYPFGEKKCNSRKSKITLIFPDESKIEMYNLNNYKCDEMELSGSFLINISDQKKIKTTPIRDVRIYFEGEYHDFLSIKSDELLNIINCLI